MGDSDSIAEAVHAAVDTCATALPICPPCPDLPPPTVNDPTSLIIIVLLTVLLAAALHQLFVTHSELERHLSQAEPATRDVATQFPADALEDSALAALRKQLREKRRDGGSTLSDAELRRYLQAANLNAASACQRILATERWRGRRMIHSHLSPSPTVAVARRAAIIGTDAHGRACLRVRLREPLDTFPDELLHTLEAHFSQRHDADEQICVLLDLRRFEAYQRPPLATGFALVRTLRAHYPQRCARVHIVHMPPLSRWLVSAVCSLLDSRTARKLVLYEAEGASLASALRGSFEPSQLPIEYGGTDTIPLLPGEHDAADEPDGAAGSPGPTGSAGGGGSSSSANTSVSWLVDSGVNNGMFRSASGASELSVPDSVYSEGRLTASPTHSEPEDEGASLDGAADHRAVGSSGASSAMPSPERDAGIAGATPSFGGGGRGDPRARRRTPRYVWSALSEEEAAQVAALRRAAAGDAEMQTLVRSFDASTAPDDELIRFLADCNPPYDPTEGLNALRVAARARAANITYPLPIAPSELEQWRHVARFDGVTRDGEPVFFVTLSRAFQDALLRDAEPFLRALVGLLDATRRHHFRPGVMESVHTVVQVERGFALSLRAIADFSRATHRVMGALTDMYPSLTSHILVVNLPSSLSWFVRFVKGFLCEASAQKIELVNTYEELLETFEDAGMPSYYRQRRSILP